MNFLKNAVKSAAKYAAITYLGFQIGSNYRALEMRQHNAVIPIEIARKGKVNFTDLVSDVTFPIYSDGLEEMVFHMMDSNYLPVGRESYAGNSASDNFNKTKEERY